MVVLLEKTLLVKSKTNHLLPLQTGCPFKRNTFLFYLRQPSYYHYILVVHFKENYSCSKLQTTVSTIKICNVCPFKKKTFLVLNWRQTFNINKLHCTKLLLGPVNDFKSYTVNIRDLHINYIRSKLHCTRIPLDPVKHYYVIYSVQ